MVSKKPGEFSEGYTLYSILRICIRCRTFYFLRFCSSAKGQLYSSWVIRNHRYTETEAQRRYLRINGMGIPTTQYTTHHHQQPDLQKNDLLLISMKISHGFPLPILWSGKKCRTVPPSLSWKTTRPDTTGYLAYHSRKLGTYKSGPGEGRGGGRFRIEQVSSNPTRSTYKFIILHLKFHNIYCV